jgi:hypothetical protein
VTTNDHKWPRMTTNDHEWPRVISVFKNHKIIIKTILRWLVLRVFCIILHYSIQKTPVSSLHMTWRRNLLDTLTMLSWTLQCATFVLKVRYHGNSVLRIRLKHVRSDNCTRHISQKMPQLYLNFSLFLR